MRMAFCLPALLALTGCATLPEDNGEHVIAHGADVAREVKLCKTHIAELEARLGTPSRDGVLGTARITTWVVEWDPLTKYLGVMTDAAGTDLPPAGLRRGAVAGSFMHLIDRAEA